MKFALINHSSAADADMALIAQAMQVYCGHVCTAWGLAVSTIDFVPGRTKAPDDAYPMVAFDAPDVADALGYHDVDPSGKPYGRAFLNVVPGKVVLRDVTGQGASLAGVISHELAEMLGDLFANLYADGPLRLHGKSYAQVALELADPVQESAYPITVQGRFVDASNFVLPAWFDPKSKSTDVDYLKRLKAPMTLDIGGYAIVRGSSGIGQIFGRGVSRPKRVTHWVPPRKWRLEHSAAAGSRSHRRLAA